jgi:amino-acid N-acetyltransferase
MKESKLRIEPAAVSDLSDILKLLDECDLPRDGFEEHINAAVVARDGQTVIGSAALERYGSSALLRSVAVVPSNRGKGLGKRLVTAALELAREKGVDRVFLLTMTAPDYFPKFGFRPILRDLIPSRVRQSVEFTSACPASAVAMELRM